MASLSDPATMAAAAAPAAERPARPGISRGLTMSTMLKETELKMDSGDCFVGLVLNNMPVSGTMLYTDGAQFRGTFQHGKKHGRGLIRFPHGDQYEGCFSNDYILGEGKFIVGAEGVVYSGKFGLPIGEVEMSEDEQMAFEESASSRGFESTKGLLPVMQDRRPLRPWAAPPIYLSTRLLTGKGGKPSPQKRARQIIWSQTTHLGVIQEQRQYIGRFVDGQPVSGEGVLRIGSGEERDRYEGELSWDGKPHGIGEIIFANGDVFNGEFRHGKPYGKGVQKLVSGEVYEGDVVAGKRQGQGRLEMADGCIYEGEFYDDVFDGRGRFVNRLREAFIGTFRLGLKEGRGRMEMPGGTVFEGTWQLGLREGMGVTYSQTGECHEMRYRSDQMASAGRFFFRLSSGTKRASPPPRRQHAARELPRGSGAAAAARLLCDTDAPAVPAPSFGFSGVPLSDWFEPEDRPVSLKVLAYPEWLTSQRWPTRAWTSPVTADLCATSLEANAEAGGALVRLRLRVMSDFVAVAWVWLELESTDGRVRVKMQLHTMTHRIAEAERDRKALRPWITRSFVRARPVIDWQSPPEITHNSRTLSSCPVDLEAATRRSIGLGAAIARRRVTQAATAAQAAEADVQTKAEAAQELGSPSSSSSLGDDEIGQLFRRNSESRSSEVHLEAPDDVEDEDVSAEVQTAVQQSSMNGDSQGGLAACRRATAVPRSDAAAGDETAALPGKVCIPAADKMCDLVDEADAAECDGAGVAPEWEQPIEEDALARWDATNREKEMDAGVMRDSVAAEVEEAVDDSTLLEQAEPDRSSASGKLRKTRVKSKKVASSPRGLCAGSRA